MKVWIDTDIHQSEPDDTQSLIHAVMLHQVGMIDIEGISIGCPRGEKPLVFKVLRAFNADGINTFELGEKVYIGLTEAGHRKKKHTEASRAMSAAIQKHPDMPVFCWGAATNLAHVLYKTGVAVPYAHLIASWNREQDEEAHRYVVEYYAAEKAGERLYVNEDEFRNIYRGWPAARNKAWCVRNLHRLGNVGKLWKEISEGISICRGCLKMGDTPSVQWAIEGCSPKYRTNRKKILGAWREVIKQLYGEKV